LDTGGLIAMFGKSCFFALALAGCLAPNPSCAQGAGDAGVSGIPRGPGSAGGLNNSINDPSGIGNAARIAPPPVPGIAVPAVPSVVAPGSTASRPAPILRRSVRHNAASSRLRRSAARAPHRVQDRRLDSKLNICRGC
jgi:hypothetical protein